MSTRASQFVGKSHFSRQLTLKYSWTDFWRRKSIFIVASSAHDRHLNFTNTNKYMKVVDKLQDH
jgi:hypothetical protein